MAIKRFGDIMREARGQLENSIVTAGLNEGEPREVQLIEKVAALISKHVDESSGTECPIVGAFRVMFSTVEALAGQIDEVIDEHERRCGCDGSGHKDPNGNGGLLH